MGHVHMRKTVSVPSNNQIDEWDNAYLNKDNFLFYPHEEVIRFVSRCIRKKTGKESFVDAHDVSGAKILDLGCGIGRHVIFCEDMKLDSYGIDLSIEAINYAQDWLRSIGGSNVEKRLQQADARQLPWKDGFFDFALSHGVLDSMPYDVARSVVQDLQRVMSPGALFYCDLISGDDSDHYREFSGEKIVETQHERGTMQCYFNMSKIEKLFKNLFSIEECQLIRHEHVLKGTYHSRYCLILRRL